MSRTIDLSTVSRKKLGQAVAACRRTESCYYLADHKVWVADGSLPNGVIAWGATITDGAPEDREVVDLW